MQPQVDDDDYQGRQDGYAGVGPKDYKTCKAYAKAYAKMAEEKGFDDDNVDAKKYLASIEDASGSCTEDPEKAGEYYGQRCGASFTGSSMAALFGLLCVSLALW